jgi:hypothetical protein
MFWPSRHRRHGRLRTLTFSGARRTLARLASLASALRISCFRFAMFSPPMRSPKSKTDLLNARLKQHHYSVLFNIPFSQILAGSD